ncbi:31 kDa ribonucleoprotein, chloroplastic [Phlyctema vagabunda]|uniref:31 kDa ribonucleoprotein, chloroplastic n=1 Tax=Phlyctema vagabunda TaxID=108571 RepID=A0ABR4PCD1_9HELO
MRLGQANYPHHQYYRAYNTRPFITPPQSFFRAASSPSLLSKSRSLTTSTPFALRSKAQSQISTSVFRRYNSDDAEHKHEESSISEYASETASSLSNAASETAEKVGQAAGFAFGSSEDTERRPGRFENRPERKVTPGPTIYVGNLLFDITEDALIKEFEPFGQVKSAKVMTDARGLSKGFANVEFETAEEAAAAIEAKNQSVLGGRRMIVNYVAKSSRPMGTNAPSKTLFIGNLAFEMSDADLNKLFREIRNVIDVRVAIDRRTGQPRGFAHADFVDVESAVKGLEALQNKELYGRTLRVDYSSPATGNRR